jgi:hypothetical protein
MPTVDLFTKISDQRERSKTVRAAARMGWRPLPPWDCLCLAGRRLLILAVFAAMGMIPATMNAAEPIRNDVRWTDTDGNPISCHDGGITRAGDVFYWYGTSYKGNPAGLWGRKGSQLQQGFNCYSSKDLVHWKHEGVCLRFPKEGWLAQGTSHRPNVLYCDKTGKYVLWFFCIGVAEPEYPAAMLAVAVSDKPTGPFTFLGQRNTAEEHGWGQDLGLFKAQDGKGYVVYDDGHRNIRIDLLADDFLSTSGKTTIALKTDGKTKMHEGAALIRYKGKYIAAGSGVEGWNPTDTSYAVADAPLGPYREMGLMSEKRTWNSQISNFVYIAESDTVFAMCDRWFRSPEGQRVSIDESSQLWLPLAFDPATRTATMRRVEQWNPWQK